MNTPSFPQSEPENEQPQNLNEVLAGARKWRVQRLAMHETLAAAPSRGEQILPWLMLLQEACCAVVILIGLTAMLSESEPLLPLWSPFLFMGVTYALVVWLYQAFGMVEDQTRAIQLPLGLGVLILFLFVCWVRLYTEVAFFLDPRWLLSLLNDLLLLNGKAFLILFVCICGLFFAWRVLRLSVQKVEPSQTIRLLVTGLSLLGLVILIRLGNPGSASMAYANVVLLFLIPGFLMLGLTAHALAYVVLLRGFHPGGLEGSSAGQERPLLAVMGIWSLLLLVFTALLGSLVNPTFMAGLVQLVRMLLPLLNLLLTIYDWLANIFATLVVILLTPLFWLLSLLHFRPLQPRPPALKKIGGVNPHVPVGPPDLPWLLPLVKVLLLLVIVLLVVLIARLIMRKRRRTRRRRGPDLHESLWSWTLFRMQLKLVLLALFRRFWRKRPETQTEASVDTLQALEPQARSVREIYRAMLKRAAGLGHPRRVSETPDEFKVRLSVATPRASQGLSVLTEAYLETRYGGVVPDAEEVERVKQSWSSVEQQWSQKPRA